MGPSGPVGPTGPPGRNGGGVTYVRWGRKTCPQISGTTLVYEGIVGGAHYLNTGGGANYICLTTEPAYQPGTGSADINYSPVYGSEYQTHHVGQGAGSHSVLNHDVPCAVCEVSTRSKHLMIPGTYICPYGWTTEYYGWLMAEYKGHKGRTMYTCVDRDPEGIDGSSTDTNGVLFYHTEADCTTGLCGPYNGAMELSCVVCTK